MDQGGDWTHDLKIVEHPLYQLCHLVLSNKIDRETASWNTVSQFEVMQDDIWLIQGLQMFLPGTNKRQKERLVNVKVVLRISSSNQKQIVKNLNI